MSRFLPYNPVILSFDPNPETKAQCTKYWPKCTFSYGPIDLRRPFDVLWIDNGGLELEILHSYHDLLPNASIVYTSTDASYYPNLRSFLEYFGFTQVAHWYWEGKTGHALFVKQHLYSAAMRTLSYCLNPATISAPSTYHLAPYFHQAPNKSNIHSIDSIDFIYMINLDERPEKYSLCAQELGFYGIHPYRFSAVNGWKLSPFALSEVGVKIFSPSIHEQFMGTIYKSVDGNSYPSNELIRNKGEAYYILGMSLGSIGIVLSHLSVLQDAYDSGFNTIWVMEDDVEVIDNPWQIPSIINKLDRIAPDWDILFTDIDTKDRNGNRVPCRAVAARPNFQIEPLDFYLKRFYAIDNEISGCGMRYGAYSMIVRRSGMKKILDYYRSFGIFTPYDMDFWLVPNIKMFTVNKDIVSTRVGAPTDNGEPGYLKNIIK